MKPPAPEPDRPRPPLRLGDRRVYYVGALPRDSRGEVRVAGGSVSYIVGRRAYDELAEILKPWEGES